MAGYGRRSVAAAHLTTSGGVDKVPDQFKEKKPIAEFTLFSFIHKIL